MDHLPHPVLERVGGPVEGERVFVLLDDDTDRPDRGLPEWGVLTAVLAAVAVRVEPLSSPVATDDGSDLEVLVTVANADNETRYLPALQAAGYDLVLRLPGYRVLTLRGSGVRVHVIDDDDSDAAVTGRRSSAGGRQRARDQSHPARGDLPPPGPARVRS